MCVPANKAVKQKMMAYSYERKSIMPRRDFPLWLPSSLVFAAFITGILLHFIAIVNDILKHKVAILLAIFHQLYTISNTSACPVTLKKLKHIHLLSHTN